MQAAEIGEVTLHNINIMGIGISLPFIHLSLVYAHRLAIG